MLGIMKWAGHDAVIGVMGRGRCRSKLEVGKGDQ